MSRISSAIVLAMLVLTGAMGLKTVVTAHGDSSVLIANGTAPIPPLPPTVAKKRNGTNSAASADDCKERNGTNSAASADDFKERNGTIPPLPPTASSNALVR